jgi:hypothetical protein
MAKRIASPNKDGGLLLAIDRHPGREFDTVRKSPHWSKRKLKRDE